MKSALTFASALIAAPALAHEGLHMHPHADDPAWLPLLISGLIIVAATLAWRRTK